MDKYAILIAIVIIQHAKPMYIYSSQYCKLMVTQNAKESDIVNLTSGIKTYRHDWGDGHGILDLDLKWNGIRCENKVFVSASEFSGNCAHAGSANYSVLNVMPYENGIKVRVHVNWDSAIRIRTDYLVV